METFISVISSFNKVEIWSRTSSEVELMETHIPGSVTHTSYMYRWSRTSSEVELMETAVLAVN